MAENEKISIESTETNNQMNILGMEFSVSDILGKTIIEQWKNQLTEEDMKKIYDGIDSLVYQMKTESRYDPEKERYEEIKFKEIAIEQVTKDRWGSETRSVTPIFTVAEKHLKEIMANDILTKLDEITQSDKYKKRIEELANNILDELIDNYKERLIDNFMHKFIGDTITPNPYYYGGIDLRTIVQEQINLTLRT